MEVSPGDRCGTTWPEDYDVNSNPDHQTCCWRETIEGSEYCIWHADPQSVSKSIEDLQSSRVSSAIRERSSVSLISNQLTEVLDGANLSGMDIGDAISFEQVTLRGADLSDTDLGGANFSEADLRSADLSEAIFWGYFETALRGADLSDAYLHDADLTNAYLKESNLSGAELQRSDLSEAILVDIDLSDASIWDVDLSDSELHYADLTNSNLASSDLSGASMQEANLAGATVSHADLSDANLWKSTLSGTEFNLADLSGARLGRADFSNAKFHRTDLTGTDMKQTTGHNADLEEATLSRATLFDADLRGAKLHGCVLGNVRINGDTQFLGPPSDNVKDSPHSFSAVFSKPCCVYDRDFSGVNDETNDDKAKSVYQALEELANRAAQTRLQSQCFVRRQDIQKNEYRRAFLYGPQEGLNTASQKENDGTEPSDFFKSRSSKLYSLEVRAIAGLRYIRTRTARMTLLYGESPWRIIAWSIGFIFAIAAVYPLNEWLKPVGGEPITYSRIAEDPSLYFESLYFSTLTFTTLGMGDYEPLGWGQVIATLNTAFGAILVALLVFVLGRRAAR